MKFRDYSMKHQAMQQERVYLRLLRRVPLRLSPPTRGSQDLILVKFTARSEIPQVSPHHFSSQKTGLYDWVEYDIICGEGLVEKAGGRIGRAVDDTAAVELQFGNMALEGTFGYIRPMTEEEIASSSQVSSAAVSFCYVTDQAHTNTLGPFVTICE